MSAAPPPPPPLPGTAGSMQLPTYREQKQMQQQLVDPIQEQLYANLPAKLNSAMNKDKKPFSYTLGAPGENGVLDLNQIKSPRMKKRLQANLRGDEDPRNEIKTTSGSPSGFEASLSPEVLSMMNPNQDQRSQSPMLGQRSQSPMQFKIPAPPQKSVSELERQAYYGGDPNPGLTNYSNYEQSVDEQLAGLYKSLGTDNNNNSNSPKVYNHNSSPKPFSPSVVPNFQRPSFTPVQSPLSLPNGTNQPFPTTVTSEQEFPSEFPRPPPPTMSLLGDHEPPRPKSPVVPNPQSVYQPNLQEQWLAKKQGIPIHHDNNNNNNAMSPQQALARQESYDRKMEHVRATSRALPPNPANQVYMPTLQEKWEMKHQQQQPNQGARPNQQSMAPEEEEEPEPVQSRSFKILQKLTDGFEDELEAFKQASEQAAAAARPQGQQSASPWREEAPRVTQDASRSKSPVVPNPPSVYMPTLQEQWQQRKQQQQQNQNFGQNSSMRQAAPSPPQRQISGNDPLFYPTQPLYQQSPSIQAQNLYQNPNNSNPCSNFGSNPSSSNFGSSSRSSNVASSSSASSNEIIIPIHVESRVNVAPSGNYQQQQNETAGSFIGSSFPSRNFDSLRFMTGEDPLFSSMPNFQPSFSLFNNSGIQGTDF